MDPAAATRGAATRCAPAQLGHQPGGLHLAAEAHVDHHGLRAGPRQQVPRAGAHLPAQPRAVGRGYGVADAARPPAQTASVIRVRRHRPHPPAAARTGTARRARARGSGRSPAARSSISTPGTSACVYSRSGRGHPRLPSRQVIRAASSSSIRSERPPDVRQGRRWPDAQRRRRRRPRPRTGCTPARWEAGQLGGAHRSARPPARPLPPPRSAGPPRSRSAARPGGGRSVVGSRYRRTWYAATRRPGRMGRSRQSLRSKAARFGIPGPYRLGG